MSRRSVPAAVVLAILLGCASTRSSQPSGPPGRLTDRSEMVRLGGETFTMGFDQGETDEAPAHEVKLAPFLMDRYEVTNSDYRSCISANVCGDADSLKTPGFDGGNQPVVGVSWLDADRYCKWVEKRLPTEAEWEYAVRGTDKRQYPWGPRFTPGWANVRGTEDGFKNTAPVGSFKDAVSKDAPIYDLVGNAAEWVEDWYDPSYYRSQETFEDPSGPDGHSGEKVVRGGSHYAPDVSCRASSRDRLEPNVRSTKVGFRCAATP